KAAGIDWTTDKSPLYRADGSEIKGRFELHTSTGTTLDIVGNDYRPTQNAHVMEFFNDLVRKGDATMETMGSLQQGKIVWAMAALNEGFTLPGGDAVRGYLFIGSPHMRGRSLIARVTQVRDVCNNTIQVALRLGHHGVGDVFRMNHRNEFTPIQQQKAKEVLGVAREQVQDFEKVAKKLRATKVNDDRAHELFTKLFAKDPDSESRKVAQLVDAYHNAPGALPGNAWGVLNAVTYYTDHMAGKSSDRRLTMAWTGRNAAKKVEALDLLRNLAA
ncbi:MAG: DUF932 domain-containing protein, partial [Hyphomicrobiaceae bacterium]